MPRYHRTLFIILLAICLGCAVLYLLDFLDTFELDNITSAGQLMPALGLQVIAVWLSVLAWKLLLAMRHHPVFSWPEAFAHIGITLMGKYLPGRVWGLLGRGFLLKHRGIEKGGAFTLVLADHFLMLYTGAVIGVFSLIAVIAPLFITFLLLLAIMASIPVAVYAYPEVNEWLLTQKEFLRKRMPVADEPEYLTIIPGSFSLSLVTYAGYWIVTAGVLCSMFEPMIDIDLGTNRTLIIAAIPLSTIASFLAYRATGGVGVREMVILAVLMINMPFGLALAIAVTHRLFCMLNDLLLGLWALGYLSYTFPGKKKEEKSPQRGARPGKRPRPATGRSRGTSAR